MLFSNQIKEKNHKKKLEISESLGTRHRENGLNIIFYSNKIKRILKKIKLQRKHDEYVIYF